MTISHRVTATAVQGHLPTGDAVTSGTNQLIEMRGVQCGHVQDLSILRKTKYVVEETGVDC